MNPLEPFKFSTDKSDDPDYAWVVSAIYVRTNERIKLAAFDSHDDALNHEKHLRHAFKQLWHTIQPSPIQVLESVNRVILFDTHE